MQLLVGHIRELDELVLELLAFSRLQNPALVPERVDLVRGKVQGHPDGYGFVVPDEGGEDLFLPAKEMEKVLHGDRVIARVVGVDRRGRPAAEPDVRVRRVRGVHQ